MTELYLCITVAFVVGVYLFYDIAVRVCRTNSIVTDHLLHGHITYDHKQGNRSEQSTCKPTDKKDWNIRGEDPSAKDTWESEDENLLD